MCICIFHLRDGTSWIPRYRYDSFWCGIRMHWFLYAIIEICICVLNVSWFILGLIGHHVTTHFDITKSIFSMSQYFSNSFNCNCNDVSLLVIGARFFAYATKLIVALNVQRCTRILFFVTILALVQKI